tara:strand:+ start:1480 stop:1656 length:177 start_codon:yes stop_codon:yes gene_type:complete
MYTNAQYYDTNYAQPASIRCDINGVTSFVPIDPANTDYANIMALVAAGELIIAPAEGG